MTYWLSKWSYIISERLTPARPKWLHLLVCSHCRGISRWCREQQRMTPPAFPASRYRDGETEDAATRRRTV